ncbi:Sh3 domain-containing ysc84-like protein [Thalictrum thalictroides]|uniref:Sh3 domain-containing ysc84-like protein n=1 Tax=Thalictrum thalictroides TaxID=46969 RepID=A0A7J6X5L8_THATH|nr:Sh3 domain-containing ysc84-like protein [Thalictrum thalictroides]
MAISERRVSYPLVSDPERENEGSYVDDYGDVVWDEPNSGKRCPSSSKVLRQEYPYQLSHESDDFNDGGYDYNEEPYHSMQSNARPPVTLKNVVSGIFSILTGQNKGQIDVNGTQNCSTNVSFLVSGKNGDIIPSAPPLLEPYGYHAYKEVLETEPPEWLPDSATSACMQCTSPFTALTRGRHHCRFCGGIFCRACSKGRCLMPIKFRERNPRRVCDACYDRLDPLQGVLINCISNAAQAAKHDVSDWTCTRGWLNLPVGLCMEYEIYKSTNTLRNYFQVARLNPEKSIPLAVLKDAKGLAILTVAKVGMLLTYKIGTGLVVARRSDGSWSAPSAILSAGLGWGAQIGGPVGRALEADLRAGDRGSGMCYTYSLSKGAFVGVSLEGNMVASRMDTNLRFYGDPYLTMSDILLGTVERPKAAEPLYAALKDLYLNLQRKVYIHV